MMTTRTTASAGMTGATVRTWGVGKGRALPGGGPTGAASRRLAAVPAPQAAGSSPLRAAWHRPSAESSS